MDRFRPFMDLQNANGRKAQPIFSLKNFKPYGIFNLGIKNLKRSVSFRLAVHFIS
jgi:hypothetical protein